ncbi:MAG: hypothetical protein O3A93_08035 [Chloroflexi bacterium]|nr:hypothetical protein [Chloroflexota bacterium]MDA1271193.1 hypothetical protein [Chloroflexota bacterium]
MAAASPTAVATAPTGYFISANRIISLMVLTFGLYLVYWLYLTWRHYRDHTGENVFPVWHSLTLIIPIYGLFRIHAHMRIYKEMMTNPGLASTISPGWAVAVVAVSMLLENLSLEVTGGWTTTSYSFGAAVVSALITVVSITLVTGLLVRVQGNMNHYWSSLTNVQIVPSKLRVGEVIFSVVGLMAWAETLTSLLSASYRGAG